MHRCNWPTVMYPRQERPDNHSWLYWKSGLNQVLLRADKRTLRTELGAWKHAESYHHKWRWNHSHDRLYRQSPHNTNIRYYTYKATVRRHHQFNNRGIEDDEIPRDFTPVAPTRTTDARHRQIPFAQIYPFPRPTIENEPETITHMILQLHPSLQTLVRTVERVATDAELLQCIASRQIIRIASDGGAIPGRASYGWILQIGNTPIAKGKGPTFGDDPRSFRAEGYGMASALLYLRLLQRQYDFKRERNTTNMLICDNEGLLIRIEKANSWSYITPNVTLRAEWDVESLILEVLKELQMKFLSFSLGFLYPGVAPLFLNPGPTPPFQFSGV
jgi:hypothetical protein